MKNYLDNILLHCPQAVALENSDFAIPHQSISPREILANWVRNDSDTSVHEPVNDWNGGEVHPNSIREFEDDFEAMEYVAEMTSSPVTIDNVGNPSASDVGNPSASEDGDVTAAPAADAQAVD